MFCSSGYCSNLIMKNALCIYLFILLFSPTHCDVIVYAKEIKIGFSQFQEY